MVELGLAVDATTNLVPTFFFSAYQGNCNRDLMALRAQVIRGRDYVSERRQDPSRRTDGKIRLCILSAYLRDHTIGRLNIGRIAGLDRERIHLTIASASRQTDALSARFKGAADEWLELSRNLPEAIAQLARADIDLLLFTDVGMDSLTSTLVFSRFAPVQVATWGHPDTTGSPMIDYYLSSDDLEVETAESHYTEKLVRMHSLATVYECPSHDASPKKRSDFGLPAEARIYACPQTLFKLHPDFDEVIVNILASDPKALLVFIEGRVPAWEASSATALATLCATGPSPNSLCSRDVTARLPRVAGVGRCLYSIHSHSEGAIAPGNPWRWERRS